MYLNIQAFIHVHGVMYIIIHAINIHVYNPSNILGC